MTTVSLHLPSSLAGETARPAERPGFWRRLFDAMVEAQMRKALVEVNRYKHLVPTDEATLSRYGLSENAEKLPFVR